MTPQRIYESCYGPLNVPTDISVAQFLTKYNPDEVPAEKILMSDFDFPNRTLTHAGLREQAARCATGLFNVMNAKEGDVICIWGFNSVNWALLAHSIMWTGAIFCGINPVATRYELVHYFEISQPKVVAVDIGMVGTVEEALKMSKGLAQMPRILLIDDESGTENKIIPWYANLDTYTRAILKISSFH